MIKRDLPEYSPKTGARKSNGSPRHSPKGNGNAGTDRQSRLIEFVDQNDLPVAKDMETLSPKKSVDRGAGKKHVSLGKKGLVNSKGDGDVKQKLLNM